MADDLRFAPQILEQAAFAVFRGAGSPGPEAGLLAQRLVQSSLAGHDSHGILRVHYYMTLLRDGLIQPGATPEIVRDNGSTVLIRGHRGYGQVVAEEGMRVAVERARKHGIACAAVYDLLNIGRLADYVVSGAKAGMVSFIFTATGGSAAIVAPFGGKTRRMSTNPFAMAVPSGREFPVVFDMATSVIANGKLRVAKDAAKGVTPGLIIDKDGNPSTDALDVERGGAILPLGGADKGYKGYLMGFLVEVLGGLLTGGGFQGKEKDPLFSNPSFLIAIDVERFRPLGLFQQELEQLIAYLKSTPTAPGNEVLAPGEVEERHERQRRKNGIALPEQTVSNLQSELDRYGVRMKLKSLALG